MLATYVAWHGSARPLVSPHLAPRRHPPAAEGEGGRPPPRRDRPCLRCGDRGSRRGPPRRAALRHRRAALAARHPADRAAGGAGERLGAGTAEHRDRFAGGPYQPGSYRWLWRRIAQQDAVARTARAPSATSRTRCRTTPNGSASDAASGPSRRTAVFPRGAPPARSRRTAPMMPPLPARATTEDSVITQASGRLLRGNRRLLPALGAAETAENFQNRSVEKLIREKIFSLLLEICYPGVHAWERSGLEPCRRRPAGRVHGSDNADNPAIVETSSRLPWRPSIWSPR